MSKWKLDRLIARTIAANVSEELVAQIEGVPERGNGPEWVDAKVEEWLARIVKENGVTHNEAEDLFAAAWRMSTARVMLTESNRRIAGVSGPRLF